MAKHTDRKYTFTERLSGVFSDVCRTLNNCDTEVTSGDLNHINNQLTKAAPRTTSERDFATTMRKLLIGRDLFETTRILRSTRQRSLCLISPELFVNLIVRMHGHASNAIRFQEKEGRINAFIETTTIETIERVPEPQSI